MSDLSKKVGILVATVIESFSMYWIAPYFPSVAKSQDIPFWLIGVIFSACPLMSLICSPSVPFLMERFGRKAVMLTGLFWLGIGNCVLILVLVSPVYWSILFSFLGRILIGLGYSWTIISKMAILISEFPQEPFEW